MSFVHLSFLFCSALKYEKIKNFEAQGKSSRKRNKELKYANTISLEKLVVTRTLIVLLCYVLFVFL